MRPRTYKGDSLVQAWVDRRKLAMLSRWLDEGGMVTKHLSDVLKFTIDQVVEHLVSSGAVEKIEFTSEATEMLSRKYNADLNPGERGKRNLLHNMQLDEMRKETISSDNWSGSGADVIQRQNDIEAQTAEGVRIYKELEKQDLRRDLEEQKRIARQATNCVEIGEEVVSDTSKEEEKEVEEIPVTSNDKEEVIHTISDPDSCIPRKKTEAELDDDAERIRKKDEERLRLEREAFFPVKPKVG